MNPFQLAVPALAVGLLQLACAAASPPPSSAGALRAGPQALPSARPDWVETPARRYPAHLYLTGVGSGIDPTTAENRAKALIAEIFSTRIESTTSISESERLSSQGPAARFQATHQAIRATAQKEIAGVRIAEGWQDADGLFWSLAVLDRRQAQQALVAQIQELDRRVADAMADGGAADREGLAAIEPGTRLERARRAVRIATALQARASLSRDLGIAAVAGMTAPAPGADLAAAERWADQVLGDLHVAISGDLVAGSEAIASAIVGALAAMGLSADLADAPPDLEVEVTLALLPPLFQGGWHWARGSVQVNLMDARANALLQSFEVRARKSSTDEAEAGGRLMKALGEKVSASMRAALVEALR